MCLNTFKIDVSQVPAPAGSRRDDGGRWGGVHTDRQTNRENVLRLLQNAKSYFGRGAPKTKNEALTVLTARAIEERAEI